MILDKQTQYYIYFGLFVSLLTWIIFKLYYPYPYFTYDSYLYLADAVANVNVSYRPIGYSKFIRWLSYISHSQYFIVSIQYFLFRISIIYLFVTLRILLKLDKSSSIILFLFLFFNPLFLDACNHILSDSIFTAISVIWFTQLIWIIYGSSKWIIFSQGVLLLLSFVLRYNALYYPAISTLILLLCPLEWKWKITGILFQFLLVGSFYFYTGFLIKKSTNYFQFSPMSSWKVANNALYMIDNMKSNKPITIPQEFVGIDTFVNKYLKSPHYINRLEEQDMTNGSFFIFMNDSPLNKYLVTRYGSVPSQIDFFKVAPYFKKYGSYLIRNHPFAFFKFVIWPNFQQYLIPNTEVFNSGDITLYYIRSKEEKKFASPFIEVVKFKPLVQFGALRSKIFSFFPVFQFILHINFLIILLLFLTIYRSKYNQEVNFNLLLLIVVIWIVNLVFSTISAPSVLRFEMFISIIEFPFVVYFIKIFCKQYFSFNRSI
jgi:hypothetical protein